MAAYEWIPIAQPSYDGMSSHDPCKGCENWRCLFRSQTCSSSYVELKRRCALLPDRWRIRSTSCKMIGPAHPDRSGPLPLGYQLQVDTAGATTAARIVDEMGRTAARGFAAELGDVFVYDRIFTERDHRRKRLGRTIMAALSSARTSARLTDILVATADGAALYTALGWRVYSPYSSADIPSDA